MVGGYDPQDLYAQNHPGVKAVMMEAEFIPSGIGEMVLIYPTGRIWINSTIVP